MKKIVFLIFALFIEIDIYAQKNVGDSVFCTYIYNEEYKVYLDIDLYDASISVPGQDIFGLVPGYFGAIRDSRKWLIASAKIVGNNRAELDIVNDYGSEDLTAILIYDKFSDTYTLKQVNGSRLKIVVDRKWLKIPSELKFVVHKRMPDEW